MSPGTWGDNGWISLLPYKKVKYINDNDIGATKSAFKIFHKYRICTYLKDDSFFYILIYNIKDIHIDIIQMN